MKAIDFKRDWPVWLFYVGLGLYLLSIPWQYTLVQGPNVIGRVQYAAGLAARAILLLRLLLFLPSRPRYALVCFCLLGVLKFSSVLAVRGQSDLFHLALVVMASRDADIRIILKVFLSTLVFFLIACPASYALGWSGAMVKHIGTLKGCSLGFGNPNSLACFIMAAAYCALILKQERRTSVIWLVCLSVAAFVWFLTLSRTISISMAILPLLFVLLSKWRSHKFIAALPVACLLISLLLAAVYGPGYGSNTFESRFSIPALVYRQCGLSLFGQDCGLEEWFHGEFPYKLAIDNCFLNLFLCNGVVAGILAMAFITHLMLLIGKKGDPLLSAIACVVTVCGTMELLVLMISVNFLPLFYFTLIEESSPAESKWHGIISLVAAIGAIVYIYMPVPLNSYRPGRYGTIEDIPAPDGYVKSEYAAGSFPYFISGLPLAKMDSAVTCFDGRPAVSFQQTCYRIVDVPLIDKNEQCADVCMRLRAEYLYDMGRFRKIGFTDNNGNRLRYRFGACRPLFERYLRKVFAWCNTESLRKSLPPGQIDDIVPGDIFVYDASSRPDEEYGHAVMVAAVAIDPTSGRKAVLLLQGSIPACDIHIVSNTTEMSPWFLLGDGKDDMSASVLIVGKSEFSPSELYRYE